MTEDVESSRVHDTWRTTLDSADKGAGGTAKWGTPGVGPSRGSS